LIAPVIAGIPAIAGVPLAAVVPLLFEGVACEYGDPTVMILASLPLPASLLLLSLLPYCCCCFWHTYSCWQLLLESGNAADCVPDLEGVLAFAVDPAVTLTIFLLL
jgi:hypothetical protein